MSRKLTSVLVLLLLSQIMPVKAHHAVLRFNLEEMVAAADRIFIGKCVNVTESEEFIAQGLLPVTTYTFAVSRVFKGDVPKTFTFKQLGFRPLKAGQKMKADPKYYIHGMKGFHVGDELMLMLIPQYMDGKLTYPVGLYQGAFFIKQSSSGRLVARNSINNSGLFTNPYNNYSKAASQARIIFPDEDQVVQNSRLAQDQIDRITSRPGALPLEELMELVASIVETEVVR